MKALALVLYISNDSHLFLFAYKDQDDLLEQVKEISTDFSGYSDFKIEAFSREDENYITNYLNERIE